MFGAYSTEARKRLDKTAVPNLYEDVRRAQQAIATKEGAQWYVHRKPSTKVPTQLAMTELMARRIRNNPSLFAPSEESGQKGRSLQLPPQPKASQAEQSKAPLPTRLEKAQVAARSNAERDTMKLKARFEQMKAKAQQRAKLRQKRGAQ